MTTTSTLSREQLEELEVYAKRGDMWVVDGTGRFYAEWGPDLLHTLIDMAMRTEQAERERDALRAFVVWLTTDTNAIYSSCADTPFCQKGDAHSPGCAVFEGKRVLAALAEPDAGGDA